MMIRELAKDKIESELRELVRVAQCFGVATCTKNSNAEALGRETYERLAKVHKLVDEARSEAYAAGVTDGEAGELGRRSPR